MSRTKIKPNGAKKSGRIIQAVGKESPFAALQNAVLALAQAQGRAEKTQRVQGIFEMLRGYEASFLEVARQLGAAEHALLVATGGEFQTFQFGGQLPAGTKIRVVDSKSTPAQIVDGARGRFIKLPSHVEPMAIELQLPSGEVRTIVPGQPVVVDAEAGS